MASMNKVFLMGNLTRNADLRFTPGGSAVCEFGLAVNRRYVANGQEKDEPCFVDIVVWGKQAESCNRFLEKGSPVLIEGRLHYDQWEDKETGGKRSRLRVVAERVQFLGRGGDRREDGQDFPDEGEPALLLAARRVPAPGLGTAEHAGRRGREEHRRHRRRHTVLKSIKEKHRRISWLWKEKELGMGEGASGRWSHRRFAGSASRRRST